MSDFKKFLAVWLSVIVTGTIFTVGTVKILYVQPAENQQNSPPDDGNNHFSVQWMGFFPTYNSAYPDYYICINDLLPSTLTMNIALQIKNQEASGFYFKIEKYVDPPTGWTVTPFAIGYIDVSQTYTFTYVTSRLKPASPISGGRLSETLDLVVKAYYDSGYSSLYSQDDFPVNFHFIDRTSADWTLLYNNKFDDGTVQGWSGGGSYAAVAVSTDYYRSYPYSLELYCTYGGNFLEVAYKKSFLIGAFSEAYLVFAVRSSSWSNPRILFDGVEYFRPDTQPTNNVWYQFTLPLPVGKTTEVQIYATRDYTSYDYSAYLDNVYVIAK
jgi:hypothetical protein